MHGREPALLPRSTLAVLVVAIDTACSSGLLAVHQACQALRNGDADLAIAGAVSLMLSPEPLIGFARMKVLSPDGKCRPFDADANGFVFGEGGGVLVLKPLARALADGNPIRALIRGGAVNHNGRSFKVLAPHGAAQQAVICRALANAGTDPRWIRYVEANGTGSPLGDAIECQALGTVMTDRNDRCRIGSVKPNIGNLGPASGIAGLAKVVLALEHRQLPPNIHFHRPNPQIRFDRLPLDVQQELGPWPEGTGALIAGVSAFGIGGANVHLILEEAPSRPVVVPSRTLSEPTPTPPTISCALSAATPDALVERVRTYRDWLGADDAVRPPLRDICYTAAVRRVSLRHRCAVIGSSHDDIA